jgi:hypothetical protein
MFMQCHNLASLPANRKSYILSLKLFTIEREVKMRRD